MLIIVNFRWWNSSNSFHNFFSEYMLLLYLKKWYLCLHLQKVSLVAPTVKKKKKILLQCGRPGFDPWVGKIPWRRIWQPTPVFSPGESPWTEEPGGLQSMGSQRVGHDWQHVSTKPSICSYSVYFQLHLLTLLAKRNQKRWRALLLLASVV